MRSYAEQEEWKRVADHLPEELRFAADYHPEEEWWEWRGNTIHLDVFRNPDATAKVILLHGVETNGRQMSTIVGGPLFKDGFETIALEQLHGHILAFLNEQLIGC